MGDKVKVTLVKGAAKVQNYQGLYEVTGAKDETWCKVEKVGTANVTPIEITADKLAAYQAMTVTIKNASSNSAGTWCTADKYDTHTFTAGGTDFTVYCQAGSVFAGQTYVNATGDLTGVATMYRSAAQIAPRNLDDVKAFSSSEPAITGVDPDKVSFTAEGGTKDITVTVANGEGKTLSASGLSGILSATVSGNVVTVKAQANASAESVSQTLKITLDGTSSSVEVPVTVSGKSSGEQQTVIVDFTPESAYPAGFPTSSTEKKTDRESFSFGGTELALMASSDGGYYRAASGDSFYLLIGKTNAYIELPAVNGKKLVKVVAVSRDGASSNVIVGITDTDNNAVAGGEAVKWDNKTDFTYTYSLSGTSVNTSYRVVVTNKYNAQFTKLELIYE